MRKKRCQVEGSKDKEICERAFLYPMPRVISASHMPKALMGGSQTGGTGV